jgi:hypothetical protein
MMLESEFGRYFVSPRDIFLLNTISSKISFLLNPLSKEGTCKVRNKIETKRNRTKRNEIKQHEAKPNKAKLMLESEFRGYFVSPRDIFFFLAV